MKIIREDVSEFEEERILPKELSVLKSETIQDGSIER
jgi:hypothetical protein